MCRRLWCLSSLASAPCRQLAAAARDSRPFAPAVGPMGAWAARLQQHALKVCTVGCRGPKPAREWDSVSGCALAFRGPANRRSLVSAPGQEQSISDDRSGSGQLRILGFRKRLLTALEALGMRSIEPSTTRRASLQGADGQSRSSRPAHSSETAGRAGAGNGRQGHAGCRCPAASSRPVRHG